MKIIKKTCLVLCIFAFAPHIFDISSEPIKKDMIAQKSLQASK